MQQFQSKVISQRTQTLIDKLVLGKLSLAEIAKVTGIPEQWLQSYLNTKSELISQ